jgi:glycerol uptake facilitator protein
MPSLLRAAIAECVGTFLLVLFGTGCVAAAVFTGAQMGLWQVAVVWGFGVTLAIYASAAVSGAHLNPAVTLTFALFRSQDFPATRIAPYIAAQLAGAALAGLVVFAAFSPFIERYESQEGITRGEPRSERSAMAFGEYFPTTPEARVLSLRSSLASPVRC